MSSLRSGARWGSPRAVIREAMNAYTRALWATMNRLDIDGSLWWKLMVAVGIQFVAGVALAMSVVAFEGTSAAVVAGGLLVLAVIAFFNTALIVREDLIRPLQRLKSEAEAVANGSLDGDDLEIDQRDEVGSLADSFDRMRETLRVTAGQADALATESFDDPALDRSVPGDFGDSLDRMADNLSTAITDLEARSARLTRLIEEFEAASARASDGELHVRLPEDAIDEQFAGVVESYNEQLGAFEAAISRAKPFAENVATASGQVQRDLSAVNDTSAENAGQVDEIAADAARQSEMLDSLAGDAETLSATVEEIAAASNELSQIATETATSADDGVTAAHESRAVLHTAAEIAAETDDAVSRLVERTESIREIVSFIDDVASRTNLLAINASIEAARTDTGTEGFEVVAREVKSLAEETRESAGEIETLIEDIDAETQAVETDVERLTEHIERAVATVDDTTDGFVEIANDTARIDESAAEISSATDQQAHVASGVSATVDELAGIGDATAARADAVAANVSDESDRLDETTESVAAVAEQADRLVRSLETFAISSADAGMSSESSSDTTTSTVHAAD